MNPVLFKVRPVSRRKPEVRVVIHKLTFTFSRDSDFVVSGHSKEIG